MAKATAKLTAKPPQNAATKPNWRTWSGVILDIATNMSEGERQVDRKAVEIVGRSTIEHAEIAADESGEDQREDRQCGIQIRRACCARFRNTMVRPNDHVQFENFFLSSRCKTLPVALRGISLSAMKA